MEYENFKTRYNVMDIFSLEAFSNIKGGVNRECKDVYFMRAVGSNQSLIEDIKKMDRTLSERVLAGQCRYNRVNCLPALTLAEEVHAYSDCYEQWVASGRKKAVLIKAEHHEAFQMVLGAALEKAARLYGEESKNMNMSIEKNFIVKMMYWFDQTAAELTRDWNPKNSMKFVIHNICKRQEYLFCYLLTLVGIDVLLLQFKIDIDEPLQKLKLSKTIVLGAFEDCVISLYQASEYKTVSDLQKIKEPKKPDAVVHKKQCREMEFEELALLASSVVMIAIHDEKGEVIGSGSGIMVGAGGYILTNNHVVSGGRFYSVRIEDDETVYKTDEVIKYNPVLDLAMIRIERTLTPLSVYQGEKKLVRGQKVVAIGSPLGLFNSVSDGIISGFRTIETVDMIQFTAPATHGSSGGALLNMFGEVIGIITSGIDSGQNIGFAVGFECINQFIRGFV